MISSINTYLIYVLSNILIFRNISESVLAPITNMNTHKRMIKRYDLKKLDTDLQLYRTLILVNKMKVFLTSCPTTDQSKVTMDVNIGNHIISLSLFYIY